MNKYLAEIVGTMVPVLIGCSVAVSLNCSSDCTDVANVSTVIRHDNGFLPFSSSYGLYDWRYFRMSYVVVN